MSVAEEEGEGVFEKPIVGVGVEDDLGASGAEISFLMPSAV